MIPEHLEWALQEGRIIQTDSGSGHTRLHRLADLVLPTGRILIGRPGPPDEPSPVRPSVAPGRYPVFASLIGLPANRQNLAFVLARFEEEPPVTWEEAGTFFTDCGTGCLMDESSVPLLEETLRNTPESWRLLYGLKSGVFGNGDCSLMLNAASGANAILFETFDSRYPCFLGKGKSGAAACLVVDCR